MNLNRSFIRGVVAVLALVSGILTVRFAVRAADSQGHRSLAVVPLPER